MKTEAITFLKEDVLSLGRMVSRTTEEMARLLQKDARAKLEFIEEQEDKINEAAQEIEEKCLDLLMEREVLSPLEIRTLLGSTVIAAKFERMADHANRIAKTASWAIEDQVEIPSELAEMAGVIQSMVQDVLLGFLSNSTDKAEEVAVRDNRVDYLHDSLSKRLLSTLGDQDRQHAQMRAQFLFCARFLERMGDACVSIAKRVYFISTGIRLKI